MPEGLKGRRYEKSFIELPNQGAFHGRLDKWDSVFDQVATLDRARGGEHQSLRAETTFLG